MRIWILISIVAIALTVGTLSATEPDAKELAQRGHSIFKAVIAGDEAKLPESIQLMEDQAPFAPFTSNSIACLPRKPAIAAITKNNPSPARPAGVPHRP